MECVVLCFSHDLQVIDSVVSPVSVDVMNDLVGGQKSTEMLFHYQPMLHNVPLAVSVWMVRSETSPVTAASAIGDSPLESGVILTTDVRALPCPFAFSGAELPVASSCFTNVCAALSTVIFWGRSPSSGTVALPRTIARRLLPSVFGMKRLVAMDALKRHVCPFHSDIIAREERYCEIAARRLEQQVLPIGDIA